MFSSMGGTIVVIHVNVSQKYIYARERGVSGSHKGGVSIEQGVGCSSKKGYLGDLTLHMIGGFFRKIYIKDLNDASRPDEPCD